MLEHGAQFRSGFLRRTGYGTDRPGYLFGSSGSTQSGYTGFECLEYPLPFVGGALATSEQFVKRLFKFVKFCRACFNILELLIANEGKPIRCAFPVQIGTEFAGLCDQVLQCVKAHA